MSGRKKSFSFKTEQKKEKQIVKNKKNKMKRKVLQNYKPN